MLPLRWQRHDPQGEVRAPTSRSHAAARKLCRSDLRVDMWRDTGRRECGLERW